MNFERVQPYRSVFIAELHASSVRSDGKPLYILDGGVGIHVVYYVVDEFGDVLHPVQSYFVSPVLACAAADILIDNPKMFDAKVTALLRYEKNLIKEF